MGPAIVFSLPLVGGGVSTGAVVTNGPTNCGLAPLGEPQPPAIHPVGGALTSITSAAERPKLGVPQIARSSLVCRGPSMSSPVTKTIRSQFLAGFVFGIGWLSRPSRRYLVHCELAPVSWGEGLAKP